MNKVINRAICAVLIFLNVQSELHSYLRKQWSEMKDMDVTWYFHKPPPYKVNLPWLMFLMEQDLYRIGLLAIICALAKYISFRIFVISAIYFAYQFVDSLALWYDYKQSDWFYWIMQGAAIVCIWLMCKPMKEEKGAKIKRLFE